MINRYIILIIVLFLGFSSCNKFVEDEGIPSFVHIDRIGFSAGIGQGTDSAYITDAWVYIDDAFHGAYELPATFPLLRTGSTKITIKPGVIINGISGTRSINPFYNSIPLTLNLVPDSTINLTLQTSYVSNAVFPWNSVGQEDFEQGGVTIDTLNSSIATIVKSTLDVYEGDYSGLIHLDTAHNYFIGTSFTDYSIPDNNSGLILELNCKNTDNILTIGIYFNLPGGTVSKQEYLYVNPTEKWKKLYVNFTTLIANNSSAESYKIFFSSSLPSDKTQADVFLDNIKLVHF